MQKTKLHQYSKEQRGGFKRVLEVTATAKQTSRLTRKTMQTKAHLTIIYIGTINKVDLSNKVVACMHMRPLLGPAVVVACMRMPQQHRAAIAEVCMIIQPLPEVPVRMAEALTTTLRRRRIPEDIMQHRVDIHRRI